MNGKNLLIGLSYIDQKYIEESEKDMPMKNVTESKNPHHKKMGARKLLLIAATAAAMLLLMGAAIYTRWSYSMQTAFNPSESAKRQAEKSGLSVMYGEAHQSEATAPGDGCILSDTDQGVTVSVVQTIADPHMAHIILRVEGFRPPEGYEIRPMVWQEQPETLGGEEHFWGSSGADFGNGIINHGGGKYTYMDGTPVEENEAGWQKARYLRSDGSMELDVWYHFNSGAEELLGKEYQLHITGFGIYTDAVKADGSLDKMKDGTYEKLINGHWDLKFPLKGSAEVIKWQPNVRLSDNVTLLEIEIGQLTSKALYKTDTYWDGWETLQSLTPGLEGIVQKDGTFIQLTPGSERYLDQEELIYMVEYRTSRATIDLNQVKDLAYYDGWEYDVNGKPTNLIYRYIPVS